MKRFLILAALLMASSACGKKGSPGPDVDPHGNEQLSAEGSSPGNSEQNSPSNSGGQLSAAETQSIRIEAGPFLALNDSYAASPSVSNPTWSVKLLVNGAERFNHQNVAVGAIDDALRNEVMHHFDVVRAEITVRDGDTILATNQKKLADDKASTKKIWNKECGHITDEVKLENADITSNRDGDYSYLVLQVCDFVSFTTKPVLSIASQHKKIEKKTVIYKCTVPIEPDHGYGSIKAWRDVNCTYGYEALPGKDLPTIEIPSKFAIDTNLYAKNRVMLRSLRLSQNGTAMPRFEITHSKAGFGSTNACHTVEMDLKSSKGGEIGTFRYQFKRNTGEGDRWVANQTDQWPHIRFVRDYYSMADDEKANVYLICDWIPETTEIEAGNIAIVAPQ